MFVPLHDPYETGFVSASQASQFSHLNQQNQAHQLLPHLVLFLTIQGRSSGHELPFVATWHGNVSSGANFKCPPPADGTP